MANEARISAALQITKGNLRYTSQPTAFLASVAGAKGPSPGAVTATPAGTDVDFSELVSPSLCRLMNLDATNFVEYGIWDGSTFYPLGAILPGESYVIRLSPNLGSQFGVGTGTTGVGDTLRLKADTDDCVVLVEAFEL